MKIFFNICFLTLLLFSCKHEKNEYKYLFLGHIYDDLPIIDERINIDSLLEYDQIWLGGDLTFDTAETRKLNYLDSVLQIKSKTTHWALGNHDVESGRQFILDFINKPAFYATYINGLTLLVFDSNYNDKGDCEEVNKQTNYIKMVCDSITKSSHLILMGHHVPWGKIESIDAWQFANTSIENRVFQCDTFDYFHNIIYPELVKVQNKNIQVISLAGDLGQKQSTYQYKTKERVQFLASGILSTNEYNKKFKKYNKPDSVLIFKHQPKSDLLQWEFKPLNRH